CAHPENAVLAMKNDFPIRRQVVGDQSGHTDAKVDVRAVVDVLGDALGELLFGAGFVSGHIVSFDAWGLRLSNATRLMISRNALRLPTWRRARSRLQRWRGVRPAHRGQRRCRECRRLRGPALRAPRFHAQMRSSAWRRWP